MLLLEALIYGKRFNINVPINRIMDMIVEKPFVSIRAEMSFLPTNT